MLGRVLRLDAINEGLMLSTPPAGDLATFTTYLASGNTSPCPRCSPPSPCLPCCAFLCDATALPHPHPLINFNTGFNWLCEFLNSPEQHREL